MPSINEVPTPPPEGTQYSRPSPGQASADAIPLLVDETYHVFHLTTPPYTRHHPPRLRSTWSRLRSTDIVTWTRDPEPVIRPGNDASSPDADGAWTGSAVLGPDGNMQIFYTGYNLAQNGKQVILRTSSKDRHGSSFDDTAQMISIHGEGLSQFEEIDFRDPYVFFNDAEQKYWMLVATRLAKGPHWTRGCLALLTSSTLNSWEIDPQPLYAPNDMFCPECPELFSLPNGKWYLVYSRFHAPNAGTVYRVADNPRGPFRIPRDGSHGRLDGRRWYASKSCPKSGDPSKRVYFGWIGDYVDDEGKWLWGGDLGVPREVSADECGNLRVDIAEEFRTLLHNAPSLSSPSIVAQNLNLSSLGSKRNFFPDFGPEAQAQGLFVTFNIEAHDANSLGLILQADGTDKGHQLVFTQSGNGLFSVSLMTDFPPLDDFWADQYSLHLRRPVDGPELVRHDSVSIGTGVSLLLRDQLVEVFCGGRSLSWRLPLNLENWKCEEAGSTGHRLGWFVNDGTVLLTGLTIQGLDDVGKTVL